ncbi:MAG: hypothetical protein MJZ17_00180 [Bacteroidales bacterium]|nr:hypothetical protein [Bacteroidales bacterium]
MKTTFKFIIAAMAAVSVFSSCQKELANETVNNTTGGVRTIAVQFDNSTKATLDEFTPKFANGDAIRVSNTEKSEECTVSVDGSGNATFSTTLSGNLTAIYPSAAAVLASEATDAPIASSNNFKVLATQDGTVEKAIIASATVEEGVTTATFDGLTALFQITPPAGATTFTITSLNKIDATTGRRSTTANAVAINTEGADDAAKRVINVNVPSDGTAYVALKVGVNLTDLSFDAGGTYGMKGIPAKDITAKGKTDATAAKTKYTIDNTNWHPYVTVNGKKWATMNIGATALKGKPYCWGYILAWGAVKPFLSASSNDGGSTINFNIAANNPDAVRYNPDTWAPGSGFEACNAPYYNGSAYTKYTGESGDSKDVLDLVDDAAYYWWGGSWRMPTKEEFDGLISLIDSYDQTDKGCYIGESEKFFLTANVFVMGTSPMFGWAGNYWTSSLNTEDSNSARTFDFSKSGFDDTMGARERSYGRTVRALSD